MKVWWGKRNTSKWTKAGACGLKKKLYGAYNRVVDNGIFSKVGSSDNPLLALYQVNAVVGRDCLSGHFKSIARSVQTVQRSQINVFISTASVGDAWWACWGTLFSKDSCRRLSAVQRAGAYDNLLVAFKIQKSQSRLVRRHDFLLRRND